MLGGQEALLRITLDRGASIDGFDISLQSAFGRVEVPDSIHLPFGESVAEILLGTQPTAFPFPETITANFRGASAEAPLTLVGPNHLSGHLIYGGRGLPGATVTVQTTGINARSFTVSTDANGFWSSGQLPRNNLVHVTATAAGGTWVRAA
ncbi:MAG: hypothetical protein LR015_00405 [Verrucomicrobia bacterium]|nr:hypothetical protein [Verrucomicrobiota bacterium]